VDSDRVVAQHSNGISYIAVGEPSALLLLGNATLQSSAVVFMYVPPTADGTLAIDATLSGSNTFVDGHFFLLP
jgi:hypothetical protein